MVTVVLLLVGTMMTGQNSAPTVPVRAATYLWMPLSNQSDGDVIITRVRRHLAAIAGLAVGDVLVRFDGTVLTDSQKLIALVRAHHPGDKVILIIRHDGRLTTLTATLK